MVATGPSAADLGGSPGDNVIPLPTIALPPRRKRVQRVGTTARLRRVSAHGRSVHSATPPACVTLCARPPCGRGHTAEGFATCVRSDPVSSARARRCHRFDGFSRPLRSRVRDSRHDTDPDRATNGATVTGDVALTATSTAAKVQFLVDGATSALPSRSPRFRQHELADRRRRQRPAHTMPPPTRQHTPLVGHETELGESSRVTVAECRTRPLISPHPTSGRDPAIGTRPVTALRRPRRVAARSASSTVSPSIDGAPFAAESLQQPPPRCGRFAGHGRCARSPRRHSRCERTVEASRAVRRRRS